MVESKRFLIGTPLVSDGSGPRFRFGAGVDVELKMKRR